MSKFEPLQIKDDMFLNEYKYINKPMSITLRNDLRIIGIFQASIGREIEMVNMSVVDSVVEKYRCGIKSPSLCFANCYDVTCVPIYIDKCLTEILLCDILYITDASDCDINILKNGNNSYNLYECINDKFI